jgi:putative membrane-bound dehydrogenase-like protein
MTSNHLFIPRLCHYFIARGLAAVLITTSAAAPAGRLKVLFLGDAGKREPAERMTDLTPPMLDRGIEVVYSETLESLASSTLASYHAVLVFGDHPELAAGDEAALLGYVEAGGGLVAVHSAGMNFPKSQAWAELVGARSQAAAPEMLAERLTQPAHPLVQGAEPIKTRGLSLRHSGHHEAGRTVLGEVRLADGSVEPWTWVRMQGKGRVFYTGWGGELETWLHPGFIDRMERAIRWTAGQEVATAMAARVLHQPFKRVAQKIPYNPPRNVSHPNIRKTWPDMQLPLTPEDSMRRMVTPAGFEVRLFAAEPDIRKPMAMAWDHRGRLWVAETTDYPNALHPDGEGNDRITICEDRDHDGKADKFTVFAEGLNIPTALVFSNGGVIVHAAPRTLFLKDTDGDDKADIRTTLFEGWGLKDSHAGPNSLFHGLDNWIWGAVGYSGFSNNAGLTFANGLYRFRPDGSGLEFLAQGHRNMRGIGFTAEGDVFSTGANGAPSMAFSLPLRYHERFPGMKPPAPSGIYRSARGLAIHRNIRQWDGYGIYTAGVGHHVYTADAFPPEYRNMIAFVNEPTLGVVGEFRLSPDRGGWRSVNPSNLLASDDEWFSPIHSQTGPDGAVWVIDWYNYIIQHNPTPGGFKTGKANAFESDLRDQRHGRIYRVVFTGSQAAPAPVLESATPASLVAVLAHPNQLWRLQAQRLLVERGKQDLVPDLAKLANDPVVDGSGLNVGVIHACRTLSGLGALDDATSPGFAAVAGALRHASAGVRWNAAEALPSSPAATAALLESGLLTDKDDKARLAGFRALADQPPSEEAGKALLLLLEGARGGPIRAAALAAASRHSAGLFAAAAARPPAPATAALLAQLRAKPPEPPAVEVGGDRVQLALGVLLGEMKYDTKTLRVKAGDKVRLIFRNNDLMEHNLVIAKPGTLAKVGQLADQMAASAKGAEKHYVPDSPDVLWSSPVLDPGQSHEILFTAPAQAGNYPYLCTFPGHWRIMQGTLEVQAP